MLLIKVPTINDSPSDFDRLINLYSLCSKDKNLSSDVKFDFSKCYFLRQNAVAFLGGLARLIESQGRQVRFDLKTLIIPVQRNLEKNGFLASFGYGSKADSGHTIPYREDKQHDKDGLTAYLKLTWLGRWIRMSKILKNAIVGRMWEIYENAFEHAQSDIGIFSCGQHYPIKKLLKLTVIDFGIGIPRNVSEFFNDPHFYTESALNWAFFPGTSTKPNGMGRGLGLDLLKEFIIINKGRLEIFSNNGYGLIYEDKQIVKERDAHFEGTIVNITLRCDEKYYMLQSEVQDEQLFARGNNNGV